MQAKQPINDIRVWLQRGLLAARAGDRAEARCWFQTARSNDPDNIIALLWLAWLAPSRQESLALLCRVLELDPKNDHARAGIRWAKRHLPAGKSHLDDLGGDDPTGTGHPDPARDTLRSPELLEDARTCRSPFPQEDLQARKGITAQRARRLIGPLGLLLTVAACLLAIGVALVGWYSPTKVLALVLPTSTPTVTPAPTLIPTARPTSTPTHTPNPSPTTTATHTATPTISSTLIPSLEPTPTSSPLPATATPAPVASPLAARSEKWIDVDLTQQQLTAYEGNTPVFQASVSTGLANTPTVVGQFRIYWKLTATDMAGPGYYLPGVPYTMYFYRGYALHGTYWHSNFGQPMSHGCVNLRTEDAQWIFDWADPALPSGASQVRSSEANPGTRVVVHY